MKQTIQVFFAAQKETLTTHLQKAKQAFQNHPVKLSLVALCAAVGLGAAGCLAHYYMVLSQNTAVYDDLQSTVVTQTVVPTPSVTDAPEATPSPTETPLLTIDFDALAAINADIYAWIDIPGTVVSYPLVQHESDDSYYLNYTIEHVYGLPGSIYTERCDATDFSGFNTVIYGHNMANDTMFGSLNEYRDADYFAEYNTIVIYTETETRIYQIFAAVVYDDRYIPYCYDDASEDDCAAFLNSIYLNGNSADIIDSSVSVTTDSQIITLSTCIGDAPDNRYLLVAVYLGEGEA